MSAATVTRVIACVAALTAGSSGALGAAWEHPDFSTGVRRPQRIAILPATSEMVRSKVVDAVPLVKETGDLERAIVASAAARLETLGYDADAETLSPEELAKDRELLRLVHALEQRVSEIMVNVASSPRDIRAGRFTIGEEALSLAARSDADGFLLLQSQTIVPSKGKRALSSVLSVAFGGIPVPPTNVTQLFAVLVDARTGDISAVKIGSVGGAVLKEPEKVAANLVEQTFRDYPAKGQARKLSKRQAARVAKAQASRPATVAQDVREEDVVAEFEELESQGVTDPPPPADDAEPVDERRDFLPEGAEATREPVAIIAEGVEPRTSAAPSEAAERPSAAAPSSSSEPGRPIDAIRALMDVPADQRPAPTRQIVLQMTDGGPGVSVRNMSEPAVLVSVDLGEWIRLATGEQRMVPAVPGSHRILVTSEDGVELTRASAIVSGSRLAVAEIWPN